MGARVPIARLRPPRQALVVDREAFPPEQHVQAPIAEGPQPRAILPRPLDRGENITLNE